MKLITEIALFTIVCASFYYFKTKNTVEKYTCNDEWGSSNNCPYPRGCGRDQAGSDNIICCPSGAELAWGLYYCKNLPPGAPCWFNTMCANGKCQDNLGGSVKGTCN